MAPSSPTDGQLKKFDRLLSDQRITSAQFQRLLESGDVLKALLEAEHLQRIPLEEFTGLVSRPVHGLWTPIQPLIQRVMDWNDNQNLGFKGKDADRLRKTAPTDWSKDPMVAWGIRVDTGVELGLVHNTEVLADAAGIKLVPYLTNTARMRMFPSFSMALQPTLSWFRVNVGLHIDAEAEKVRQKGKSKPWPGLEMAALLHQHPAYAATVKEGRLPNPYWPGLSIDKNGHDKWGSAIVIEGYLSSAGGVLACTNTSVAEFVGMK